MQTFLPYPQFTKSLECLDNRRLGKQRVEAMQLVQALERGGAWYNHPATQMWRGYEAELKLYHDIAIKVWRARGFKNTMKPYYGLYSEEIVHEYQSSGNYNMPSWWNNPVFHASHRSNLLRKDPIHYGQFGWTETPDLPYYWPTKELAA